MTAFPHLEARGLIKFTRENRGRWPRTRAQNLAGTAKREAGMRRYVIKPKDLATS